MAALVPFRSLLRETKPTPEATTKLRKAISEDFGNVEFEMELKGHGSATVLSRLGFDAKKAENLKDTTNAYYVKESDTERFKKDSVYVNPALATPAIYNHEFVHRGHRILRDTYSKKDLEKRYGERVASLILSESTKVQERIGEMFDRPSDPAGALGTMRNTIDEDKMTFDDGEALKKAMTELALEVLEKDNYAKEDKTQARSLIQELLFWRK